LHQGQATAYLDLRQVVQNCADNMLKRAVLDWVTSRGPFWDDSRIDNPDDYFELSGADVTDTGLGEAARVTLSGAAAGTYSFAGGGFDYSPLHVQHGLPEEPLGNVEVLNFWACEQLIASAANCEPAPTNWVQAIDRARLTFEYLDIGPQAADSLRREPFSLYVVERIFELLRVLHEFVESRNEDGTYSEKTHRLINDHFSGSKAWFTGESASNEDGFREQLTFKDVVNPGDSIFCPWHGKIKSPQFRIHFPWPIEGNQPKLKIVYIGPKLTKR
jgi:hypothetical protein